MKTKLYAVKILIFIILSTSLLSSIVGYGNYQTECVSVGTDGYINVKIWNIKKGANYKSEDARKDAVHALLFSGLAGENGCPTRTPFLNCREATEKFETIDKDFFAINGQWSKFTRASVSQSTLPIKIGPKNWKVYQVSVSINELRKYLEEQKIINSLTNGF